MLRRLRQPALLVLILIFLLACTLPVSLRSATSLPTTGTAPAADVTLAAASPTAAPATATRIEPSATLQTPTQPAPTPQPQPARTSYDLMVDLYPNTHLADIEETIVYTNDTGNVLVELILVVPPNSYENVFTLNRLELGTGEALNSYRWSGQMLSVDLPISLDPGEQIELKLGYRLELPPAYGPFGYTARQNNFGDWYPYVAARDAGNQPLVYPRGAVGDYTVQDPADYHVEVVMKESGSWLLAGSSMPIQVEGRTIFDLLAARSFGWSAGLDMIVLHQVEGGVDYRVMVYREHEAAGQEALYTLFRAGGVFSKLYAPYPHASLTLIETYLADGMEYEGMFFLGTKFFSAYDGTVTDNLTMLTAHETAHQWWYGMVGSDQALEPWLDEALCTYSELIFYENVYPDLVSWWWQFRVNYFKPEGAVNVPTAAHSDFRLYVNAVYLRGARFIHEIRLKVGDEAFFKFLAEYARRFNGKRATAEDFFSTISVFSRENLSEIISRYFR